MLRALVGRAEVWVDGFPRSLDGEATERAVVAGMRLLNKERTRWSRLWEDLDQDLPRRLFGSGDFGLG